METETRPSLFKRAVRLFNAGDSLYTFGTFVRVIATLLLPASVAATLAAKLAWVPNVLPPLLILLAASATLIYTISWFIGRELRGQIMGRPNAQQSGVDRLKNAPALDTALAAENTKLRREVAELQARHAREEWWWRYDAAAPDVPPLNLDQQAYVRSEIRRLETPVLRPLTEALATVRDDLLMPVRATDEGSFERHFAQLFYDHSCEPVFRLLGRIRNQQNNEDIRPAFKLFFEKYSELREAIQRVAEFQGRDLTMVKGYPEWREADNRLFTKLEDLPAEKPMWAIRELVSNDAKKRAGYPQALPQAASPARHEG